MSVPNGFPQLHPRTKMVNAFRNGIERMILDQLMSEPETLNSAEVAMCLSELAFRFSLQSVKDQRYPEPPQRANAEEPQPANNRAEEPQRKEEN